MNSFTHFHRKKQKQTFTELKNAYSIHTVMVTTNYEKRFRTYVYLLLITTAFTHKGDPFTFAYPTLPFSFFTE